MRTRCLVLLSLLFSAPSVVGTGVVSAQTVAPRDQVSGWDLYHWSKPRYDQRWIVVRNSTQNSWASYVYSALEDWGKSRKFAFIWKQTATDRGTRYWCHRSSGYGVIHICSFRYRWSDAGRVEVKTNRTNHILKGWIKLNNAVSREDRRSVACHEIGHILGLSHRASQSSCMYNGTDAFPPRPDKRDFHHIRNKTHYRDRGRIRPFFH